MEIKIRILKNKIEILIIINLAIMIMATIEITNRIKMIDRMVVILEIIGNIKIIEIIKMVTHQTQDIEMTDNLKMISILIILNIIEMIDNNLILNNKIWIIILI